MSGALTTEQRSALFKSYMRLWTVIYFFKGRQDVDHVAFIDPMTIIIEDVVKCCERQFKLFKSCI